MSKRYLDNLMCATFNMNDPEWIQKKMSVVDWCKQEFQCQGGGDYMPRACCANAWSY